MLSLHVSEHIHLLQTTVVDKMPKLVFACLSDVMANHYAYSELRVEEWDLLNIFLQLLILNQAILNQLAFQFSNIVLSVFL